jgi:hypothetical protein
MMRAGITERAYWIALAVCLVMAQVPAAKAQALPAGQPVRPIGVVTQIQANQLTLHTDAGTVLRVHMPEGVQVLRVPPGAKNLQQAVKVAASDIQAGDRVLIVGSLSPDQKSMVAARVIDMSKAALAEAHEAQRLEWTRRGVAGVVQSLDAAGQSLVLAVPNIPPTPANPTHPATVTLAPGAQLLRYAPDSIKFSDAKPGTFAEIKVGDQVRALGSKSPDGTRWAAVDAAQGSITVKDLATGKPVTVRTDADSKLHRLPPLIAMMIARFNADGAAGPNAPGAPAGAGAEGSNRTFRTAGGPDGQPTGRNGNHQGMAAGMGHGGPPGDFNAMLDRTPPLSLSELKPGQPLIVVSTEGARPDEVTAIAVLSGVEPILQARPKGSQEVRLGPWNMSMGGGGGAEAGGDPGP